VAVIGGGMITHDQILPSLYQLQRLGLAAEIRICAQRPASLRKLAHSPLLLRAFPGHSFIPYPAFEDANPNPQPELYREVLQSLPPGSLAIVAVPDDLHFPVTLAALRARHHVIVVKPFVLSVAHAQELEREAFAHGLFVGIEYHKRFDDRSLMARQKYRQGAFGELRLGHAHLHEKWYYRHSNFQNWCTTDKSDAFCYIGCHYVDLVAFITGLRPVCVSVQGIPDAYPNGRLGYLYTDARVTFNNGALLNVQNSLSAPDALPGTNTQGLTLYTSGGETGGFLRHSDQYRGLEYATLDGLYSEPSPDYMQYVPYDGTGLTPVGYGYRSIEQLTRRARQVAQLPDLASRQRLLQQFDAENLIATPANSRYNEALVEAARISILNHGITVDLPPEAIA
jgi:predicted dehydrogenase